MADLFLNWGALGPFGTGLDSGATATVDTGGVAVDVTFTAIDPGAQSFTFNADGYAPEPELSENSFLKLFDAVNDDGDPSTATATLDFRAVDTATFTDEVQDVSFRINDIDFSAAGGDLRAYSGGGNGGASGFEDIVTVEAFDADGNPVPVQLTPEPGGVDVNGQTATGTVETGFTDATGSVAVSIAGPVSQIQVSYANGLSGEQAVTVSDVAFTTVDVDPGDLPPVANDDTASTPEDTTVEIDVLANDSDPEGGALTVISATAPNGAVTINADNTLSYTPDVDYTGPDTITYRIEDPAGNTATGEVAVTVEPDSGPGNQAPVAVNDTATTEEDTAVTIDALANDSDPDGDPIFIEEVFPPANGSASMDSDGNIQYTPAPGFTGEDTITYSVSDGVDASEAEIVVTVTDGVVNEPPVAVPDTGSTTEDTTVVLDDPSNNDTDPEGDPLSTVSVGDPANGAAVLNPDGTVEYTPDAGFVGEDTIPYVVSDGENETDGEIVVTVDPDAGSGDRIDADIFPVGPGDQPLDPFDGEDEDPDPADDLDNEIGTGGADTILTGDDDDTISAGGGNDSVAPGIDDDLVDLGGGDDILVDIQGADTVSGGQGNDTIIAGFDEVPIQTPDDGVLPGLLSDYDGDSPSFTPGNPVGDLLNGEFGFTSDPNTDDNRDSVEGNLGNDSVETGDDADTIDGGGGNDTLDGGIDDDMIMGGQGDDSLIGGHGSDTIDGGQGNDLIDGSNLAALELVDAVDVNTENDRDSLFGALGDDTLIGGDDDDTLLGGSGADLLDGGIDEDSLLGGADSDTLLGGQGGDTLDGGAGTDSISGGDDRDVIVVSSAAEGNGDTVDGGAGGDDFDQLDLSALGTPGTDWRIVNTTTDSNGNGIDGTVEFLDGAGDVTGGFDFFEIEEVVPCFTPGTLVATPQGERLVEDLEVGDRVITRDNGIQEIRWVGRKDLTGFELARKPHMKPVLIQKGALGNGLPAHDMLVSPNHRVLVANDKTALYFEESEVLVAAKHLTGQEGVDEVETLGVSYIHVMFDQHEVILSNGAWTESFQPGDYSLRGIGSAQREEILELFPDLEHAEGVNAYASARRSLKKHEAALLTK